MNRSSILSVTCALIGAVLSCPAAHGPNLDLPYSSGSTGEDGAFSIPTATTGGTGNGMAYDAARGEVVRFDGGAQTWALRTGGWERLTPATSPPARGRCAMAFDPLRNEVVLFGGIAGGTVMNDTWVWDGMAWTQRIPTTTSPPARSLSAMAWDETAGELVLFGGLGTVGPLSDTWVWDGMEWTEKAPTTVPPAVVGHAMAPYPPSSAVAMAAGNSVARLSANNAHGDLWLWSAGNWSKVGDDVFERAEMASLVYDPDRSVLWFFGGGEEDPGGFEYHHHLL